MTDAIPPGALEISQDTSPVPLNIEAILATNSSAKIQAAIHHHWNELSPFDYKRLADGVRKHFVFTDNHRKLIAYKPLPGTPLKSRKPWRVEVYARFRKRALLSLTILGVIGFMAVFVTSYYYVKWHLQGH